MASVGVPLSVSVIAVSLLSPFSASSAAATLAAVSLTEKLVTLALDCAALAPAAVMLVKIRVWGEPSNARALVSFKNCVPVIASAGMPLSVSVIAVSLLSPFRASSAPATAAALSMTVKLITWLLPCTAPASAAGTALTVRV